MAALRAQTATVPTGTRLPDAQPVVGPPALILGRNRRIRENAASSMASQISSWLRRFARDEAKRAIDELERSAIYTRLFKSGGPVSRPTEQNTPNVRKANGSDDLTAELRRILLVHGSTNLTRAVRRTTGEKTARPTDAAMRSFFALKEVRLQQIMRSSRDEVRAAVRDVILRSFHETPRPSAGEVARRIRTTFHPGLGPGDTIRDIVPAPIRGARVLPTERYRLTDGGNLYVFSSERAALIARTELAQAENTGIADGYKQAGAVGIEWLSIQDGRSGDRRHDEMNHEAIPIGGVFVLPDGTRMHYPGDPQAPIKHLANCRCTVRAIFDTDELERKKQR